jgi:hypothetical protein
MHMKSLLATIVTVLALSAFGMNVATAATTPAKTEAPAKPTTKKVIKKHKKAEKVTTGSPSDPVAKPAKKK